MNNNADRLKRLQDHRKKLKKKLSNMDDQFLRYGPVKQLEEVEQQIKEAKADGCS